MSHSNKIITQDNLYCHVPYREIFYTFDILQEQKLNVELYADAGVMESYTEDDINTINTFFAENNLKKTLHGPFVDLNTGSYDDAIQKATLHRFMQTLTFASKLSMKSIVFHTGYNPVFYRKKKDGWIERAIPLWNKFVHCAQDEGIDVYIENSLDNEAEVLIALIQQINAKNCFACFDPAHFKVFGKSNPLECLKKYPESMVREVHLSDNRGEVDEHLPLGQGILDFPSLFSYFAEQDVQPIFTIEPHTKEDIFVSLEYLKQFRLEKGVKE